MASDHDSLQTSIDYLTKATENNTLAHDRLNIQLAGIGEWKNATEKRVDTLEAHDRELTVATTSTAAKVGVWAVIILLLINTIISGRLAVALAGATERDKTEAAAE